MSVKVRKNLLLAVAFVSGVLAVGIPYWSMAYGKVKLPIALVGPGLFVPAGAALLLCASRVASLPKVLLIMGATVPATVCLRVAWDVAADPTSHNLWPFEVVIASFLGFPCALAGAIVGSMIAWLITHDPKKLRLTFKLLGFLVLFYMLYAVRTAFMLARSGPDTKVISRSEWPRYFRAAIGIYLTFGIALLVFGVRGRLAAFSSEECFRGAFRRSICR